MRFNYTISDVKIGQRKDKRVSAKQGRPTLREVAEAGAAWLPNRVSGTSGAPSDWMCLLAPLTRDTWGAHNVLPRDITNGIEDPEWSYWGGNAVLGDDGKYHLYVCRWPENLELGHFAYHDSIVVHAVAENSLGPYTVKDTIGAGHNPTLYRTEKGQYVIYCVGKFYHSDNLAGPWKRNAFDFFKRERWCVQRRVNFTFAPRENGSYTAISRRGFAWVSPDGFKDWHLVSQESVYPKVEGIFEDPLMWKDNVQYHLIANDWKGRIAYYMRSRDGIHWVTFDGKGSGITADNFAGKLLGTTSEGKLLFGWARLPKVDYIVPVLSSLSPKFEYTDKGLEAYVEVQNFGQVVSERSDVKVLVKDQLLASGSVRPLKSFEKSIVRLVCNRQLSPASKQEVTVLLESEGLPTESFTRKVTLPGN